MPRHSIHLLWLTFAVISLVTGLAPAAQPQNQPQPDARPPGAIDPTPGPRPPTPNPQDDLQRLDREASQARDHADRLRAAYDSANKPGRVADDARESFDAVVSAYEKAIDRPITSSHVAEVVLYCHTRLAGAYQYSGQFDKALEQSRKAAAAFAGTPHEFKAVHNLGLMYLQTLHDPHKALPWLKRAQDLANAAALEPDERAKWQTATAQALERCDKEMQQAPKPTTRHAP